MSSNLTTSTFGTTTTSEPRRRFSNLSNLAQSLPSTMSSTSGFPVAGSLDLNIIGDQHSSYTGGLGMASRSHPHRHGGVKGGVPERSSRNHGGKRGRSHCHAGTESAGRNGGVRRTRSALETSCMPSDSTSSRRHSPVKQFENQLAVKQQKPYLPTEESVPAECDSQDSEDGSK